MTCNRSCLNFLIYEENFVFFFVSVKYYQGLHVYCRKRCMDLISIESQQELDFLGKNMGRAGIREIWTSGRLCDKEVGHSYILYIYRGWGSGRSGLIAGSATRRWEIPTFCTSIGARVREIWTSGRLCDKEVGYCCILYIYRSQGQGDMDLWQALRHGGGTLHLYTANEEPVRIQYKCRVPIYVFPEIKLCDLVISKQLKCSVSQFPPSCICEQFIYYQDRSVYFAAAK
jgi:hypothetical protein